MKFNHSLNEPLLTRAEAAAMLGGKASKWQTDKLVRLGLLTPLKIGYRTVRFRKGDVEQAIRRATETAVE